MTPDKATRVSKPATNADISPPNTLGIEGLSTHPNVSSSRQDSNLPVEFGRYRLLKNLGEGGMGAVFLAHDTQLDRKVALKLPHLTGKQKKDLSDRFRREAKLSATLDHPNICRIFDIGEQDGRLFMTMAFVDGKSLHEVIKAKGAVEARTAVNLMKRIATAVQFAHTAGIIHRDLKPANIMIKRDRDFVIMDFGLARRIDQDDIQLTATGAVLGTPAYMAPEQLRGENTAVGPQTDVYSLGIMLFELLTGQRPFQGTLPQIYAQVLTTDSVAPSAVLPGLDHALDDICRKATNRDVSKRFESASEFARALEEYLQPQTIRNKDFNGKVVAKPKPSNSNIDFSTLFGEIDDNKQKPKPKLKLKPKGWFRNNRNRVGFGIGIMLLLAFTGWLGVILTIKTSNGTIVIEGMPEDGDVLVDGNRVEILWNKGVERAEIAIDPGTHQLKVVVKGIVVQGETVVIQPDKKTTVTIKSKALPTLEAPVVQPPSPPSVAPSIVLDSKKPSDGWQTIFNGNDLSEWKGKPANWTVQNGFIVGSSTGNSPLASNTYLVWQGGLVDDFELEFECKIEGVGNSGVQYRSTLIDAENLVVSGYQLDIDATSTYTGSIYEEKGRGMLAERGQRVRIDKSGLKEKTLLGEKGTLEKLIKKGDWNQYRIVAIGDRLSQFVNSSLMSEVIDDLQGVSKASGVLALQLHAGPPMTVQFKNIRLKQLGQSKLTAAIQWSDTPFAKGSVWTDAEKKVVLTVLSRDNDTFHANLKVGATIERIIEGSVKGDQISWLSADVKAIKGRAGGDNSGTLSRDAIGNKIQFNWRDASNNSGVFQLRLDAATEKNDR